MARRTPDLYLIVRNALDGRVVYKTEIRKGVKQNSPDLVFDIAINSLEEEYIRRVSREDD